MESVKVILFDLGEVLVRIQPLDEIFGGSRDEKDSQAEKLFEHGIVQAFQKGEISPESFAEKAVEISGQSFTSEEYLKKYLLEINGLYSGAKELLSTLRRQYCVACLSNTNLLHWDYLQQEYQLGSDFDRVYLSHEIGLIKPDPKIFIEVQNRLAVEPGSITFFDDNPANVFAARDAGFSSFQVQGIAELKQTIRELGILP